MCKSELQNDSVARQAQPNASHCTLHPPFCSNVKNRKSTLEVSDGAHHDTPIDILGRLVAAVQLLEQLPHEHRVQRPASQEQRTLQIMRSKLRCAVNFQALGHILFRLSLYLSCLPCATNSSAQ